MTEKDVPPEQKLPPEEQTRNLTAEQRSEHMRHEHPRQEKDLGRDVHHAEMQPESPMQEKQRVQYEEQQKNLRGVPKAPAEPPQKEPENQIIMSFFEADAPTSSEPKEGGEQQQQPTEKKLYVRIYAGQFSRVVREATEEDKTANAAAYKEFADQKGYDEWKSQQQPPPEQQQGQQQQQQQGQQQAGGTQPGIAGTSENPTQAKSEQHES